MIKANLVAATAMFFTATVAYAGGPTIRINEIRIDQPSTDNDEYFELAGDPGQSLDGLSYIVIGDGAEGSGVIEAVVDLDGLSINASGLFLVAEDTFTLGPPAPDLTANLNFENSDNVTHLLVAAFTGASGDDLDTDDDGVLDVMPWAGVVDCVALVETPGEGDQIYCENTVGPDGVFVPGHVYFCEAVGQWLIGGFDVGTDDTPGTANPACTVQCTGGGEAPAVEINEIRVKQAGQEIDEYFELSGGAFTSLEGVAYVVLGDTDTQGSGVVEAIVCLNEQFILGDGLLVVAEDTFSLGDGVADLELPEGELNFVDSDNPRTHLIVLNFNGVEGQDLDTNDDGVLDIEPWDAIIDDVALRGVDDPGTGGVPWAYSSSEVGPDLEFTPGHVYRCDPDLTWTVGAFDTFDLSAVDTPGDPNESCDFVPPCGGNNTGGCFEANGTPNCNDVTCCELVNGMDPTCADNWDQACADLALINCLACGEPASGNCLEANGTPYCNDETCCNDVCAIDPTCCQIPDGWDADCVALAQDCDIPDPVQPGDVVLGLSTEDDFTSLELIRGPAVAGGGSVVTDSWEEPFMQSVEFDNLNGIAHNNRGNLLGVNYGSTATGGTIHSLATCIPTSADQFIGDTLGEGGTLPSVCGPEGNASCTSRLGGLSVSPDNSKIAVVGSDTGHVIVYDYTAGDCLGAGASLSGARQTTIASLCVGDTQGTAWLDNNTVLAFSATDGIYTVDATSMVATLVAALDTGPGCGPGYTDIEHNPDISPNVYAMYSAFSNNTTTNTLFVLDPNDSYNLLGTFDYSTSIETTREIAFDGCGNLFVGQYGGSATSGVCSGDNETPCNSDMTCNVVGGTCILDGPPFDIIFDAVNLDSLEDNTSVNWYVSSTEANFSGMDVAIGDAGCVIDQCGNGTCDEGEDSCNCLADCPGSCCGDCPTDATGDGQTNASDLAQLLGAWGPVEPGFCLDTNNDGVINAADLAQLLGAWGPC